MPVVGQGPVACRSRTAELLPVGYFHLVFTLPHELNRLILAHKKILLALLFKAVSETLLEFGQSRFGATLGITAVLHTWDQTLKDHFHLHCLVPAGALSLDHSRWIGARPNFLFPVKALSQVFQGKFLALLQQACEKGKIPAATNEIKAARQKSWVVYAKKPFGSPQTVLDYLGRYTHRVALSNDRILNVQNGQVTLSYRDRKDGDKKKTVSLEAHGFIRRLLLHVCELMRMHSPTTRRSMRLKESSGRRGAKKSARSAAPITDSIKRSAALSTGDNSEVAASNHEVERITGP